MKYRFELAEGVYLEYLKEEFSKLPELTLQDKDGSLCKAKNITVRRQNGETFVCLIPISQFVEVE